MNKVIIILIVFGAVSMTGYGILMPEIPNFFLQEVLIIEGRDQIGVVVAGEFTCDCVPMPDPNNPDTNADGIDDCGAANLNCDPVLCETDITMLPNDFCLACSNSGTQCNVAPNEEGPYFNSAAICNVDTTCP